MWHSKGLFEDVRNGVREEVCYADAPALSNLITQKTSRQSKLQRNLLPYRLQARWMIYEFACKKFCITEKNAIPFVDVIKNMPYVLSDKQLIQ